MGLKLFNSRLTVRRLDPGTQSWVILLSEVKANVQQAAPGTVEMTDQWAPSSITENAGAYMTKLNIFIGGIDDNGIAYYPHPGDQLIVTGTNMLNGAYIQVAEGAIHEGYGLDYIKMPCVRYSLDTNLANL